MKNAKPFNHYTYITERINQHIGIYATIQKETNKIISRSTDRDMIEFITDSLNGASTNDTEN